MRRSSVFKCAVPAAALAISLLVMELVIRLFFPIDYLYPRYEYSAEYGLLFPPEHAIIEERPGHYRFIYTTNRWSHRGEIPEAGASGPPSLVFLGDSNTFGEGVIDGAQYPAVLAGLLGNDFRVLNLAHPGWGLTAAIRRFFDIGQAFQPAAVFIQFSSTDPSDNLVNPVTVVRDGRLEFIEDRMNDSVLSKLKQWLSDSPVQLSQLYNLVRHTSHQLLRMRLTRTEAARDEDLAVNDALEMRYVELLDAFLLHLAEQDVRVYFLNMPAELETFPVIHDRVLQHARNGRLVYVPTADWFDPDADHRSPEGHAWNEAAHAIVARRLGAIIRQDLSVRTTGQ